MPVVKTDRETYEKLGKIADTRKGAVKKAVDEIEEREKISRGIDITMSVPPNTRKAKIRSDPCPVTGRTTHLLIYIEPGTGNLGSIRLEREDGTQLFPVKESFITYEIQNTIRFDVPVKKRRTFLCPSPKRRYTKRPYYGF